MSRPTQWIKSRSRLALVAGVVGASVLALSTTASLGGFTASITNTGDQVQTGTLIMKEAVTPAAGVQTICYSTAPGAVISGNTNGACTANKFGALVNAVPGNSSTSSVIITNTGTVPATTFKMGVGGCVVTPTTNTTGNNSNGNVGSDTSFCNKLDITVEDDTTTGSPSCVYPAGAGACPALSNTYNLTAFNTAFGTTPASLTAPLAAGSSRTYTFTVGLDATAATNADQGEVANEPITFTFNS